MRQTFIGAKKKKEYIYVCNLHKRYPEKCDFKTVNYKTISDAVFKSTKAYIYWQCLTLRKLL